MLCWLYPQIHKNRVVRSTQFLSLWPWHVSSMGRNVVFSCLGFLIYVVIVSQGSPHICECKSNQTLQALAPTLSQFGYSSWEQKYWVVMAAKSGTIPTGSLICSALFYTSSISESWGLSWSGALIFARLGKCDTTEAYEKQMLRHVFVKQHWAFISKLQMTIHQAHMLQF